MNPPDDSCERLVGHTGGEGVGEGDRDLINFIANQIVSAVAAYACCSSFRLLN